MATVVVSYNTRQLLRICLKAIHLQSPSEVVVIDNASVDGSGEMVEAEFPGVTLLRNGTNMGYGAAANRAISICSADYILLLNSDAFLQPGSLRQLSAYLDQNPRTAIAGPRLVNLDGTLQASCFPFPTPLDVLLDVSNSYRVLRRVPVLRDHVLRTWAHAKAHRVPWVLGAALAIRREALEEVGGFDESFFMYFEEVDLCYRLSKLGWQVDFAPVTDILHVGGASTQQVRSDMAIQLFSSLAHFYSRHYSRTRLVELALLLKLVALARLVRDRVLIHFARDPLERANVAGDLAAWRALLVGHWRVYAKKGRHVRLG